MSSMSHNNGVVTTLGYHVFEYEDTPSNNDEGGVGGLNCTPHLVKLLVIVTLFLVFKSCHLYDEL